MSVTLALLLATPLLTCGGSVLTFQDMLDSAQLVVIGRVDSIWYEVDTIFGVPDVRNGMMITARTYVSAEILNAYVKDTSFIPSLNTIQIVHGGGKIGPTTWISYEPSVSFQEREVFLAAIENFVDTNSKKTLYRVAKREWKCTIANDSLFLKYEEPLALGQVIQELSLNFKEVPK